MRATWLAGLICAGVSAGLAAGGAAQAQRGGDQPAVAAARDAMARIAGDEAGYGVVIGANEVQVVIATARHVVDGARGGVVTIDFAQLARRRQPAEVIKDCDDAERDIAFLRTGRPGFSDFPADILAARRAEPGDAVWVIGRDTTFEISPAPGRAALYDADGFFLLRDMSFVVQGVSGAPAVGADGIVGLVVRAGDGGDAEAIAMDEVVELARACELLVTAVERAPAPAPGPSQPSAPSGERVVRVIIEPPRRDPRGHAWDTDDSPPDFGACFTSGGRTDCRPAQLPEGSPFMLRLNAPCQDVRSCAFPGVRLSGDEVRIMVREIDAFPEPWGDQRFELRCPTRGRICETGGFRIAFED